MFKKKINKWIQIEKKNQSSIIKFKINFFSEIKKSGRQGAPAKPERWAHQRAVANWLPSVPDVPVNVSVFVCECVCVSVCVYTSVFSVRFSITHESEWCWGFIARINRIDLNGIFFFFFLRFWWWTLCRTMAVVLGILLLVLSAATRMDCSSRRLSLVVRFDPALAIDGHCGLFRTKLEVANWHYFIELICYYRL